MQLEMLIAYICMYVFYICTYGYIDIVIWIQQTRKGAIFIKYLCFGYTLEFPTELIELSNSAWAHFFTLSSFFSSFWAHS